jgi:hypothetical protein
LGYYTSTWLGSLVPVRMHNSEKYSYIIKRRIFPTRERNFPNGDEIFQHDFAPCHTSIKVKKVIEELKIKVFQWTGNSSALHH